MKKSLKSILVYLLSFLCVFLPACTFFGDGSGDGPGGGPGGGPGEGMLSVRDDINELGDNVDAVPYFGEEKEDKGATLAKNVLTDRVGQGTDIMPPPEQPGSNWGEQILYSVDVDSPEDDVFFNEYASSREFSSPCGELFYINSANQILDSDVKYVKQNVFENVTMLNRWIRWTDTTMLRMKYDQVNNVLTCEELMTYTEPGGEPYFHYHCTTSSYTADGKEIIEFISTRQRNIGDYKYSKFFRYIEDKEELYFLAHDEDMYGVVYSDLSVENPLITAFTYSKGDTPIVEGDFNGILEEVVKEIYLPQTETDCGFAATERVQYVGGDLFYKEFQQIIIDKKGLYIGYINEMNSMAIETPIKGAMAGVNLPYITNLDYSIDFAEGLDVIRFKEDMEYRNSICDLNYLDEKVTYNFNLDGLEFTNHTDTSTLPLEITGGMFSSIRLGVSVDDESDLLTAIIDSGIIYEDNCLNQIVRYLDRKAFMASHSMFGYSLDSEITSDIIHNIFLSYIKTFSHVSDEELQSYTISSALPKEDQVVDDAYYDIYDVEFVGELEFDFFEEKFSLGGIVATMPKNLALDGGETLALVAAYSTGCENYELARKEFTYNGEELVMEFDQDVKAFIPDINGEGQVNFYVLNVSNNQMRISSTYTPKFLEGVTANTVIINDNSVKRLYEVDDYLYVYQAPIFEKNFVIENQKLLSPVDFTQSCIAFIEGDYAKVEVFNGETLIGTFNYDFDSNISPESISANGATNADALIFKLTIYKFGGDEIYSKII